MHYIQEARCQDSRNYYVLQWSRQHQAVDEEGADATLELEDESGAVEAAVPSTSPEVLDGTTELELETMLGMF